MPALTPRHHWTYPVLHSTAYRQVSSAKRAILTPTVCGCPLYTGCIVWETGQKLVAPLLLHLLYLLTQIFHLLPKLLNLQCERTKIINVIRLVENYNLDNLYSKPRYHILISRNTKAEDILLLKLRIMWSVILIHCTVMIWSAWNPDFHEASFLLSVYPRTIFKITVSKSLLPWAIG